SDRAGEANSAPNRERWRAGTEHRLASWGGRRVKLVAGKARAARKGAAVIHMRWLPTATREAERGILRRLFAWAGALAPEPSRSRAQNAIPGTSAHAATWLRLRPGERGPRHPCAAGLARPQKHPTHRSVHRAGTGSV